jgi:hypothetical protein
VPTQTNPSPFTVCVEAGFNEEDSWLIDARLQSVGSRLLGPGRFALLEAVRREAQHGRVLGATKVRVHLEGHDRVSVSIGEPGQEPRGSE